MSVLERDRTLAPTGVPGRTVVWFTFALVALLLLALLDLAVWTVVVIVVAAGLAAVPALRPPSRPAVDVLDLVVLGGTYVAVVVAFRLAFTVFTTDNVLGLFLCFAAGLLIGVVGPVVYQVWVRGRDLQSLGLGLHRWRPTVAMGLALAAAQFAVTMLGYSFPAPEEWVPLLGMSLVVGLFEAVFFRGFVQGAARGRIRPGRRRRRRRGPVRGVPRRLWDGLLGDWFLPGLGVVYAVAYRLTSNVLIVWPLLTPVGAFFNNLDSGDIELPWASLMGFADVALLMAAAIWLAHRRLRRGREARA